MSETTFLGTPVTRHDIDDIQINVRSKRGREYLESKELRYRQNREQIKKNTPKILYTVDTEEGWIPSEFKSSKSNRANYNFQTLSNFTDQDDMDIISMRVLRSLKLTQRENEIYRIIKGILKSEGFIERVYGPQLPTSSHHNVRDLDDLTGVGYTQLIMESDENMESEDGGRLCWITSENDRDQLSIPSMPLGIREGEYKRYHEYDREEDLMDIKNYYKEFYKLIVKPLEDFKPQTEQDLLYQYAKPLEFISTNTEREHIFNTVNNHSVNSNNTGNGENSVNSKNNVKEYKNNYKGRAVKNYEFARELLNKFKIKQKSNRTNVTTRFTQESTGESTKLEEEIKLPNELYKNLFAKL